MGKLLNEVEAAEYLGVGRMTLRNARHTGNINGVRDYPRYVKFGRNVRYDVDDLDNWIEAHKVNPTPQETDHE